MHDRGFTDYFNARVRNFYLGSPLSEIATYVTSGKSKKIRAQLCELFCELGNSKHQDAWLPATAIEMIHAYSLTHDDLPCMDDDPIRRGKPSAHVQFDEGQALLAGDALLTDALAMIAKAEITENTPLTSEQRLLILQELTYACGGLQMVAGQYEDLYPPAEYNLENLLKIHSKKTGALIAASCVCGVFASKDFKNQELVRSARSFGQHMGIAFQVQDDLIDHLPSSGKTPNKDSAQNKLSITSVLDVKNARKMVEKYHQMALALLPKNNKISEKIADLCFALQNRSV